MMNRLVDRSDGIRRVRAGLFSAILFLGSAWCPTAHSQPALPDDAAAQAERGTVATEAEPAQTEANPVPAESADPTAGSDTESEPTGTSLLPSIRVSGSVWRSKPGIVFLQTPIGLLSLSSKTGLRDVKSTHKVTLSVSGTNTAVDIRDRATGSLVHRYVSGIPRYASQERKAVLLWTPEGEQSFTLGPVGARMPRDSDRPVTLEVTEAGAIKGVHDLQFDLQVSQAPKTDSQVRMRIRGTVTKVKSSFVFLKTSLGIVTVSAKTGVRNAKVGQDMTVWIQGDHVAIDLYHENDPAPLRRFLTGRLVYATPDKTSVMLWTPEGDKTFRAGHRGKGSLASIKEGAPITVELDRQGEIVEIRRLN
jgi:hypothetical protein